MIDSLTYEDAQTLNYAICSSRISTPNLGITFHMVTLDSNIFPFVNSTNIYRMPIMCQDHNRFYVWGMWENEPKFWNVNDLREIYTGQMGRREEDAFEFKYRVSDESGTL